MAPATPTSGNGETSAAATNTMSTANTAESFSGTSGDTSGSSNETGASTGAEYIPWVVPLDQITELGLGFVLEGPADEARIGRSIAPINDWNGDGVGDLALRSYGPGQEFGFVVFGGNYKGSIDLKDVKAKKQGIAFDGAGYNIRPLGDVNGDGIDDVGLDSPSYDIDNDGFYEGRVYIAWGQAQAVDFDFLTLYTEGRGSQITGHLQDQKIGGIVGAGDLNGDGLGDMVMSAGGARVGVLLGSPKPADLTTQHLQDGLGGFLIDSCGGELLLALGDINGDALHDILSMKLGGTALCVTYGKKDTLSIPFADIKSGAAGFVIDAASDYNNLSSFGSSGDGLGDFDGDGLSDVVVLATNAPSDRRVLMLYGGAPWPLPTLNALRDVGRLRSFTNAVLPASVTFFPDLNGDGRDELLVGDIEKSDGTVSLVFGAEGVDPLNLDAIVDEHLGIRFVNTAEQSIRLGIAVAGHDMTGDGVFDLIMSEDDASAQGRVKAGRIYVIDGAALKGLVSTW